MEVLLADDRISYSSLISLGLLAAVARLVRRSEGRSSDSFLKH